MMNSVKLIKEKAVKKRNLLPKELCKLLKEASKVDYVNKKRLKDLEKLLITFITVDEMLTELKLNIED